MARTAILAALLIASVGVNAVGALRTSPAAPAHAAPKTPITTATAERALADIDTVRLATPRLTSADIRTLQEKAKANFAREQRVPFARIVRGDTRKKLIALTFDDGPHADWTLRLIDVLQATHTPATFFLVGKQVDKFPDLVRLEVLDGFEIGNHTYDHVDLTQIPPELIGFEIDECDKAIRRVTGSGARFFRPPGGDRDPVVQAEVARRHYVTALWTDDPGDYAKPGADVVLQRTLDHLDNGSIILLHDGIPDTLSMLPTLISEARRRGYEFVTLSELASQCRQTQPQPAGPAIREASQ